MTLHVKHFLLHFMSNSSYAPTSWKFTFFMNLHVNCFYSQGKEDILIIDAGAITKQVMDTILKSAVLEKFQQVLIRTNYMSGGRIDYKAALRHYRSIYEEGFRLFWSREEWNCAHGLLTGCIYLHFVRFCFHLYKIIENSFIKLTA